MSTLADVIQRFSGKRAARVMALLLVFGSGAALYAAPAPQSPDRPPATAQERGDLRRTIESHYKVLPVSGGVLLEARQVKAGVRTIEVKGSQIAVNGEPVTAHTVRDWLGADAEPVIRLLGMTAADQRQLFGIGVEGASAQPAPAPEASTEEPPTSDTDVTETSVEASEQPEAPEAPESPEPAEAQKPRESHSSGSRVNVGGSVQIDKDEVADEAVAVGGSVDVQGEVKEQATAIGGPVRVDGQVGGEVLSVGSSVYLGPHAVVDGDVTSVGGNVHREPGAVVHGAIHEVGLFPFARGGFRRGSIWDGWGFWGGVSGLIRSLMFFAFIGMLICAVILVARRPFERAEQQLAAQPLKSAVVGAVGIVLFVLLAIIVTLLLLVTVVGCLLYLLYPFLAFYVILLFLLGYTTVAYQLGRLLEYRFDRNFGSPYVTALVGLFMIQGWSVVGHLLDLLPGPFGVISSLMALLGILAVIASLVVGIGAVILARFGFTPGYWPQGGAPMPPPRPASQPVEPLPLSDPITNPPPAEGWEEPR